ncbi:MAG: hypothetical protein GC181_11305 [Bacteroidetes bacterium]|nr:hypothetical protein [Bacteroidota bacterium]
MASPKITNRLSSAFPPPLVVFGYIFLAGGLYLLLSGYLIAGLIIMLIGGITGFTFNGVQINPDKKVFREYSSYFGIKIGSWRDFSEYPFITVMILRESYTIRTRTLLESKVTEEGYKVVLLNHTHQKKLTIAKVKGKEIALEMANDLASKLPVEYADYNPPISAQTRARRR